MRRRNFIFGLPLVGAVVSGEAGAQHVGASVHELWSTVLSGGTLEQPSDQILFRVATPQ